MLKKFRHFSVRPESTSYNVNSQQKKNRSDFIAQFEYAVDYYKFTTFLMNFFRPDIA